jgi:glycosyltransferase involved in cell wall biosynthesis
MLVSEKIAKKVYHVIADHEFGGGTVHTARLIRALNAKDSTWMHVAILPVNSDEETRRTFHELPSIIGDYRGRSSPLEIARCILRLSKHGDVVHAQGTRAAVGATIDCFITSRIRAVYTVHGFHGIADPGRFGLRPLVEHVLARRLDATVFVSNADAELARASGLRYRSPSEVIENGMEVSEVDPSSQRTIDLLFVGRMVKQKWPEAFVDVVSKLPRKVRAVMIGTGELAASVDKLISQVAAGRIERIDGLSHVQTLDRMAQARILVMTSRWEGLPTVAIEAAQSGALVSGYYIPPLAEVLGKLSSVTLSPSNPSDLAERLDSLLADETARVARVRALKTSVTQRYSLARMAQRYSELYSRFD